MKIARRKSNRAGPVAGSDGRVSVAASDRAIPRDSSWLKRAEEEISRLAAVAESCDLAIISQTLVGEIASWNPTAERLYGYTAAEALGKPVSILVPADRRDELLDLLERIRRGERVDWHESTWVRKDGSVIAVSANLTPMKDPSGRVIGAVTLCRSAAFREPDVEALHSADKALRIYARIVEDSPNGISLVDRQYLYRMVNPTYCRWNGRSAEEILGRTPADLVGKDAFERVIRPNLDRCFAGESVNYQSWFTYASGERRYTELFYYPLRGDREIEYAVVLGRDATDRKRAEEERETLLRQHVKSLQRIEELADAAQRRAAELQAVIDNMVDAVYVFDVHGVITLSNEAGLRLLGQSNLSDLQRPLADLPQLLRVRHRDGSPVVPGDLLHVRALAGQIVVPEDQIVFNPQTQQDVYLRMSAAPIRDDEGRIVGSVAVARDETELMALDRIKDQFISVAAHELKTPVAIMKGCAQALLRSMGPLPPTPTRMLEAINRGADRIDRVVRDLLDISRLHAGRMELAIERVDLSDLVRQVVDRMAVTTNAGARLRITHVAPAFVRGDMDRLEQVMVNLIDNAVRYSPGGGDIDIAVIAQKGNAVVSVRDRGIGIPREKRPYLFGRFFRAHTGTPHDYGGMGVGLYISREIVTRHGGRMWFESQEGKGSTFSFSLPLAADDETPGQIYSGLRKYQQSGTNR